MQFNEKLKKLRTEKGLTQAELAEKVIVSRSAVAKWENGLGLPGNESLELLAEYFGIGKEELCSDAPTQKVIVQKNRIISHSRKLIAIISAACAVAFAVIIALATAFGLSSAPSPETPETPTTDEEPSTDEEFKFPTVDDISGTLYNAKYDHDEDCWTTHSSKWGYIYSKWTEATPTAPTDAPHSGEYTLTTGEYALIVRPNPINKFRTAKYEVCIKEAGVALIYNYDVFDIVRAHSEYGDHGNPVYLITVKKPCQNEEILLYRIYPDEGITENSRPAHKLIITALPSEEDE